MICRWHADAAPLRSRCPLRLALDLRDLRDLRELRRTAVFTRFARGGLGLRVLPDLRACVFWCVWETGPRGDSLQAKHRKERARQRVYSAASQDQDGRQRPASGPGGGTRLALKQPQKPHLGPRRALRTCLRRLRSAQRAARGAAAAAAAAACCCCCLGSDQISAVDSRRPTRPTNYQLLRT